MLGSGRGASHSPAGSRSTTARLATLLLAALLVLPLPLSLPLLDADPTADTLLFCSEPNDGEILGTLLLLHFTSGDPSAHRVSVSLGGQVLGVVTLEGGACTVPIDTSALPNGTVLFEARVLTLAGETLGTITLSRWIWRPSTAVLAAAYENGSIEQVSIGVDAEWAGGASAPYILLVATEPGCGEFAEYGLELTLPPQATQIAAMGTISFGPDGTALLGVCLDGVTPATPGAPVRLQLLLWCDGKWVPGRTHDVLPQG